MEACLAEHRGVVVAARPGLGATAFLDQLARTHDAALVAGRDAAGGTPFLPLAELLAAHDLAGAEHFDVLTRLPSALLVAGRCLVVDDAERLDHASAVLVAQASRLGVPVVLGVREVGSLPESLRDVALTLTRLPLPPLTADEVIQVAEDVAGQRLDPPSSAAVVRRSTGVPGVAVALVTAAVDRGLVRPTPAGLHLTGYPVTVSSLSAFGLDVEVLDRHRDLLHRVASTGPVPVDVLDPRAVSAAAGASLVVEAGGSVRIATATVADWALSGLSVERRAALAADTAHLIDGLPDHAEHAEHAGVLRSLAAGDASCAALTRWLLTNDRQDEALALLARVGEESAATHLARAETLAALGRVPDALAELDLASRTADDDTVLVIVGQLVTLLGGADDGALRRRVAALTPRVADAGLRQRLDAALARRQVIQGDLRLEPHQTATSVDPLAGLLRESLTGSLADARSGAAVVVDPLGSTLDDHLRTLIHFLSLVYDGEGVAAREIAEREYATARHHADPVLGLWAYNRTKIALHAGQHEAAVVLGRDMHHHLVWRDPFGLELSGVALLASALARAGRLEEAESLVAPLSPDDLVLPRARLGVARVRAERLLLEGRPEQAAEVMTEAGTYAVDHDEAHSGLLGLDEAYWAHPSAERAVPLLAARDRSSLAAAYAGRAEAREQGDPVTLARVARDLEAMVQPGRAAATWEEAARLHRATGDDQAAGHAHRQAVRLMVRWGARPWPHHPSYAVPLTERESEVAHRAAVRMRSRDIAAALGLSTRTVDNHLARAFRKLGLGGREELAEALGLVTPEAPQPQAAVPSS